jgi:hypothetical protein
MLHIKKLLMAQAYCAYLVCMKSVPIIISAAAWLALLLAPCFADSPPLADTRAAGDSAAIIQGVDQELHRVNSQLAEGRAVALEPNCELGTCAFVTAFMDKEGHIRKIVDWAEGARQAGCGGSAAACAAAGTLRSIWEWYYDTKGEPIFVGGRYEGEPGSGRMQEHAYYIQNGKEIEGRVADGSIGRFDHVEPQKDSDVAAGARHELQTISKKRRVAPRGNTPPGCLVPSGK